MSEHGTNTAEPTEPFKQSTPADKLRAEQAKVDSSQTSSDIQDESITDTGSSLPTATSRKAGKSSEKRQPPTKIDIAAAKNATKTDASKAKGASKPSGPTESSTASLNMATPVSDGMHSKTSKELAEKESSASGDRAGRSCVMKGIAAPKAESTPKMTSASPTTAETPSKVNRPQSRRPSLTSLHAPNTPVSEKISDNASLTSTSMSRANSPPPSNLVGSAPVRQVSKSQQKKERQSRAKQAEESEAKPVKPIEEEPEINPIVSRKKKTKKSRNTADSTPTVTRPTSPVQVDGAIDEKQGSQPATPVRDQKDETRRETPKAEPPKEPESPATPDVPSVQKDQNKTSLTAASILSSLQRDGQLPANIQDLFKGVPGLNHRYDTSSGDHTRGPSDFPNLTATERALLDQGIPVLVGEGRAKCTVVLPDRATLSHLSKEQAQRYIALHRSIMLTPEQGFFNPSRQESDRLKLHPPTNTMEPSDDGHNLGNRFGSPSIADTVPVGHSPVPDMFPTDDRNGIDRPEVSVEEAERAYVVQKKETETLEKRLNGLLRKNRRMMFGGH